MPSTFHGLSEAEIDSNIDINVREEPAYNQ